MKKWNLILDPDALREYIMPLNFQPWEDNAENNENYKKILRQHRIVWSDAYVELIKKEDMRCADQLMLFIASTNMVNKTTKIEDRSSKSMNEWYKNAATNSMVADGEIICNSQGKATISKDLHMESYLIDEVVEQEIKNKIIRNSTLCDITISEGTNCSILMEWLNELFSNENMIYIFDGYLCNERGFACFSKYYASLLEGKVVQIFVRKKEWEASFPRLKNDWNKLATDNGINLTFYMSSDIGEHDRHIFLESGEHISIGKGIDFMNPETEKTTGTFIRIQKNEKSTPLKLRQEHGYKIAASFPLKKKKQ